MAIKLRMKNKTFPSSEGADKSYEALIRLWVLRLLVPLGGSREFMSSFGYANDHLAHYRPDMQLLSRRIDAQPFEDVLRVMRLYRATGREPHTFFTDGQALFQRLASFTAPVK